MGKIGDLDTVFQFMNICISPFSHSLKVPSPRLCRVQDTSLTHLSPDLPVFNFLMLLTVFKNSLTSNSSLLVYRNNLAFAY